MRRWTLFAIGIFFVYSSLFFLQKPHLTMLDLGRHLKNGELILKDTGALYSNFYSHTTPDLPVVNHHWLFGVLSYQVFRTAGFPGLVIGNTLLILGALFLVFLTAKKQTSVQFALAATILVFPLLVARSDIRPETVSFFFVGLWLFLLGTAKKATMRKILGALALTQIIWVNTHLFFIFGWLIAGAFLLRAVFANEFSWQRLPLLLFCAALPILSLLNPSGISGVLEPFTIFSAYNYPVAENQSVWFFLHYNPKDPQHWYTTGTIVLALFASATLLYKKKTAQLPFVLITLSLGALAFWVSRVGSFFGLALIPTLSLGLQLLWQKFGSRAKKILDNPLGLMASSTLGFVVLVGLLATQLFTPDIARLGLSVDKSLMRPAAFLQSLETDGTIFNNYDIGSYLIFSLFPKERVFIDNRPEAYSVEFLQNDYIRAQEDEAAWQQVVQKYNIGVIVFAYRDATDWAGPFIIRRVQDPDWVPVFADNEIVILVANIPKHQEIIEKYRVDPGVFRF